MTHTYYYKKRVFEMEFKEIKRKKERGMTNKDFFDNSKESLIESETVVIVGLSNSGIVTTYETSDSQLITLGMLDIAKNQIISDMEI